MGGRIIKSGDVFPAGTIIRSDGKDKHYVRYFIVACSKCNIERRIKISALEGTSECLSCSHIKHGLSYHPIMHTYNNIVTVATIQAIKTIVIMEHEELN